MTHRTGPCYALLALALPFFWMAALAQNNPCDQPGDVPDVIVGELSAGSNLNRYGPVGDITAYSMGTHSCNTGTCWLDWCDNNPSCGSGQQQDEPTRHPVIAQNLFRLKAGRFEQIGQAWLKHSFLALSQNLCSTGCQSTDGNHLGVNCSDPYDPGLNGQQSRLGPKDQVNASKGEFLWPYRAQGVTGNAIYKRLQVHNADLDPALNPGALYYAEANYTIADDAPLQDTDDDVTADGLDDFDTLDNSANNSSYRRVTVSGSGSTFNLSFSGSTVRERPAILAWPANDPAVVVDEVVVPGDGRYWVASKATSLGGGLWNYEYAILNHSSHRSARSFRVPLPFGANVSNIGFHDVDYHSENTDGTGSWYDGTDWSDNGGDDFAVTWSTQTFAENDRANALRWNTLYNFRFDADVPPVSPLGLGTVELFLPGSPESFEVKVFAPSLCDSDTVCDTGEDARNCTDCLDQGGGGGQCGDNVCNLGESGCSCLRDCGSPPSAEFVCNDGRDDDCDSQSDCPDTDCCSAVACGGADNDGDTYELCDCNDGNSQLWSTPDEVRELRLGHDQVTGTTLEWLAPLEPGAASIIYETLRSQNPANFLTSTSCIVDADPTDTTAVDSQNPAAGVVFYYEVRAENGCPQGEGVLGRNSAGIPREGRSCP